MANAKEVLRHPLLYDTLQGATTDTERLKILLEYNRHYDRWLDITGEHFQKNLSKTEFDVAMPMAAGEMEDAKDVTYDAFGQVVQNEDALKVCKAFIEKRTNDQEGAQIELNGLVSVLQQLVDYQVPNLKLSRETLSDQRAVATGYKMVDITFYPVLMIEDARVDMVSLDGYTMEKHSRSMTPRERQDFNVPTEAKMNPIKFQLTALNYVNN